MRSPTFDHRAGEGDGLVGVEAVAGTGRHEGGQLQVGIAARRHVVDHAAQGARGELAAVHLGAHVAQRLQWRGVARHHRVALACPQQAPCGLRQAGLARLQEVTVHDVERGDDVPAVQGQLDARLGLEPLRVADGQSRCM
jgi:hypothetical protein